MSGKANWAIRFTLLERYHKDVLATKPDVIPGVRIVVLDSLNLDTPALHEEL